MDPGVPTGLRGGQNGTIEGVNLVANRRYVKGAHEIFQDQNQLPNSHRKYSLRLFLHSFHLINLPQQPIDPQNIHNPLKQSQQIDHTFSSACFVLN